MVYLRKWIAELNFLICPPDPRDPSDGRDFDPAAILAAIDGADTLADAFEHLGLAATVEGVQQPYLRAYLESIPPGLDAAMLAAAREAFARGSRVQVSWQPGYDFELRIWESTAGGGYGLTNLHLTSPHPPEADPTVIT